MSTPCSASTSGSLPPSLSVRPRSTSMSSVPMHAAEPNRLRLNRAPSSSAQSTSATVTGGVPSAASDRSSSRPDITPSAPSSQPPLGTLSRCEPTTSMSGRSPRSTAHRLPASSVSTSTGKRGQRLAQQRTGLQPVGCPAQPAAAVGPAGAGGQVAQVADDAVGSDTCSSPEAILGLSRRRRTARAGRPTCVHAACRPRHMPRATGGSPRRSCGCAGRCRVVA